MTRKNCWNGRERCSDDPNMGVDLPTLPLPAETIEMADGALDDSDQVSA